MNQEFYDQNIYLLKKVSEGNNEARKLLIERNIGLVIYIAKKYEKYNDNLEDLIQTGYIGLINAIASFDFEKGMKFSSYATACIRNEICKYLNKNEKHSKEISLEVLIDEQIVEEDYQKSILVDDYDVLDEYIKKDNYLIIRDLVNNFDGREKEIIKLYYGFDNYDKHTLREIAQIMNISSQWVSKIKIAAMNKIAFELKKLQIIEGKDVAIINQKR